MVKDGASYLACGFTLVSSIYLPTCWAFCLSEYGLSRSSDFVRTQNQFCIMPTYFPQPAWIDFFLNNWSWQLESGCCTCFLVLVEAYCLVLVSDQPYQLVHLVLFLDCWGPCFLSFSLIGQYMQIRQLSKLLFLLPLLIKKTIERPQITRRFGKRSKF